MRPTKYVEETVKKFCEVHIRENYSGRYRLHKWSENAFATKYDPDRDISLKWRPDAASYFQSIVRWMIDLSVDNLITKLLSLSHLTLPIKEHLEAAVDIIACMD